MASEFTVPLQEIDVFIYVAHTGFKLNLNSNSCSSFLHLPSSGITGMYHYAQLRKYLYFVVAVVTVLYLGIGR